MKIVTVVGARPQFIKAAVVSRAIDSWNRESDRHQIEELIVHTGQHYDHNMSQVFFDELDIRPPAHNLGVTSGTHGSTTAEMLQKVEAVLLDEKPDYVLVYGDTNSTLAGALAAAKIHIPVAHVESGLRSFNRKMPEEINRILTDHIAEICLCPTQVAVSNLVREGLGDRAMDVGDVMFDASLFYRALSRERSSIVEDLDLPAGEFILATCHRAENTDDAGRLREILTGLAALAEESAVLLPMHPRTLAAIKVNEFGDLLGEIQVIEPVPFLDMIQLEENARIVATDSGGVQKEAYFFKVPCVTLRDETEWTETVASGWNSLVGACADTIVKVGNSSEKQRDWPLLYGDGRAGEKIVRRLLEELPD